MRSGGGRGRHRALLRPRGASGGALRRKAQHPLADCRGFRPASRLLRRQGSLDAQPRPAGRRGRPLHALLQRARLLAQPLGVHDRHVCHHHRRAQPSLAPRRRPLPEGVRVLSDWMRDAGYFTANVRELPASCGFKGTGKTDWNFQLRGQAVRLRQVERPEGAPAVLRAGQLSARRTAPSTRRRRPIRPRSRSRPTIPTIRSPARTGPSTSTRPANWTARSGSVLAALEQDGLADNTVVVFFGDNGQAHVRGKQFCYEEGLLVPLHHPLAERSSRRRPTSSRAPWTTGCCTASTWRRPCWPSPARPSRRRCRARSSWATAASPTASTSSAIATAAT